MKKRTAVVNAMTVDVEDYFQVSAFERVIARDSWEGIPYRVEQNTHRILDVFAKDNVKATFFVLGMIAERYPGLIKRMADEGHEVASHGYSHVRITNQSSDEFFQDVVKTKGVLEDLSGQLVQGYRAASYSIVAGTRWAFRDLQRAGYTYSSSVYPVKHDLYGIPDAPRAPFVPEEADILEIPVSTVDMLGKRWPAGGGGFFRLYPYGFSKMLIARINERESRPSIFYFHPWEIDPGQPRVAGVSFKTRFRHYFNLGRVEGRLNALLRDFNWDRMDRVYLNGKAR